MDISKIFILVEFSGILRLVESVTDLITAVVRLLQRDINGLVKTALRKLEPVKL